MLYERDYLPELKDLENELELEMLLNLSAPRTRRRRSRTASGLQGWPMKNQLLPWLGTVDRASAKYRTWALRAFDAWLDHAPSPHHDQYQEVIEDILLKGLEPTKSPNWVLAERSLIEFSEEGPPPGFITSLRQAEPGRYYRIQSGDSLFKIAKRAYGTNQREFMSKQEVIQYAQGVNCHPYNKRFWRSIKNKKHRAWFGSRMISFFPRFSRSAAAQALAKPDEKMTTGSRFAIIWLPKEPLEFSCRS